MNLHLSFWRTRLYQLLRTTMIFLLLFVLIAGALPLLNVQAANKSGAQPMRVAGTGNGGFNYSQALQKAILFYEAQRSGPYSGRLTWRGDSGMTDGADVGVDLKGGWYDAGDHVKFGFPMAASTTVLAWGAVEYRSAYSGQIDELLDNIKWATDYFLKAYRPGGSGAADDQLYGQVGTGSVDHAWWGPAEVMQMARPSYKVTAACPGSDLAGETAAALAASSIAFRPTNAAYADQLLSAARGLYTFADTYRGKYSSCITDASSFYNSWSGFNDELIWGALWLYRAEEAKAAGSGASYMTKAQTLWNTAGFVPVEQQTTTHSYRWGLAWDDKIYGVYVLGARFFTDATAKATAKADAERWLDFWAWKHIPGATAGIAYSPGGRAHLDTWGSLRYAANTAFVAYVYADTVADATKKAQYYNFASSQINYALGANPTNFSYVIGFGTSYPQHPHHRTAHSSFVDSLTFPEEHRHILYGALVGGPGSASSDTYTDVTSDYVSNEVATDYNAGFTSALARMTGLYGGTFLADSAFPLPDKPHTCVDEFPVEVKVNASGTNFTEYAVYVNNRSGWPAFNGNSMKFRWFYTLEAGATVTANSAYTNGSVLRGPTQWNGSVYYVELDFTGNTIYPGGQSPKSRREVQFRLTSSGAWDTTNDHSAAGWTTYSFPNNGFLHAPNAPVYNGTTKLCGTEASGTPPTTGPTIAPPTVTRTNTQPAIPTNTPAGPTATRTATRTNTRTNTPGGPTATRTNTRTNTPVGPTATRTNTPVPPTVVPTTGPTTLKVQYRAADTNASDNQIKPHFNIVNTGSSSVAMSELKIRYYFTKDAGGSMVFNCDWAVKGCGNLSSAFVAATGTNTDTYLEISFTAGAGSIAAGQSSGEMQIRLNKSDWTNFNESNDYSFDPTKLSFADWTRVVLLRNGTVVWGTAP